MTKKQIEDLETIEYFVPDWGDFKDIKITDENRKSFLLFSERGIKSEKTKGYEKLLEGKRWRGIHMGMYEEGILDATMPYYVLLGGYEGEESTPRSVVNFMKKEMFKGHDADVIENAYQLVLSNKQ